MAFDAVHDISSLLSSERRDFLIRNNGDQVKISSLIGKRVGLYFSAGWCPPCRLFTPKLSEFYKELLANNSKNNDFEIIFISSDRDALSFKAYFSKMPWLSIPFDDLETQKKLKILFQLKSIPYLVGIDGNGKSSSDDGVNLVKEFGSDAYPFTADRKKQLLAQKEEAKKNTQTITSVLASASRNYLVSNDGKQIPVSKLEGKLIGLYFSLPGHEHCEDFTPKLSEVYNKLKKKDENFEIVFVSLEEEDEDLFDEAFESMPWLALPFKDEKCQKLKLYFDVGEIPALVITGQDGRTLNPNAVDLIKQHGIDAYPFTPKKHDVLHGKVEASCGCDGSKNDDDKTMEETKDEKVEDSCGCDGSSKKDDDKTMEETKDGNVEVSCGCDGSSKRDDDKTMEETKDRKVEVSCGYDGSKNDGDEKMEETKDKTVEVSCGCDGSKNDEDEKMEETKDGKVEVSCCGCDESKNDDDQKMEETKEEIKEGCGCKG
uniref:protein-disulfide reductase n=1 Tax=Cucumis melo TaxID=3656 RepID=Q5DMW8_CUCME|nr:protein disulfide isomerase (PDI)-like protein 4 [Cucumis melo]